MSQNDGLIRATPETTGTDPAVIVSLLDEIRGAGIEMHSLLVWHDGALITEAFWHPYGPHRLHMMHSVTKSVTSMAVGLAIADGYLMLDDRVIDAFPEHRAIAPEGVEEMRLEHLLTMTSGHGRGISGGAWRHLATSWIADFLRQPMTFRPGTTFVYDSACSYMLSAMVQRAAGRTVHEYLDQRIFQPMGMSENLRWDLSPEGINAGGNGLNCTAADLLKIGLLHLQGGRWQGRQLLPEDWVRAATATQVRDVELGVLTGEVYLGPGESANGAVPERRPGYGYQWWRGPNDSYSASGLFGQTCIVLPVENAVVAFTAGMQDDDRRMHRLIQDRLRPALGQWTGSSLPDRLGALHLSPAPASSWSDAPAGWQGRYRARANDQGVRSVTLGRQGDALLFSLTDDRGTHTVRAGLGHRIEGETTMTGARLHHAYEPEGGLCVAAWAHWCPPASEGWSTLTLDWAFVETAFRDTVICRFKDGHLVLDRSVNVNSSILSLPRIEARQETSPVPAERT